MYRRKFIQTAGAAALSLAFQSQLLAAVRKKSTIKTIEGSWFEFQHHSAVEGKYWDLTLEKFSTQQWEHKVKEVADAGIRYLVLLDVTIYDKSFYPSKLMPQHTLGCDDPLEAVLTAADKYGIRFFISNGFVGDWYNPMFLMKDKATNTLRAKCMNEVAEKYAHHKSFYGWYYPNETGIHGHFDDVFINYVNTSSAEARKLTPKAKTLIAPYGTRNVKADENYVRQLEELDVDFIAYQDEVGVQKTKPEESGRFYEQLYKVHKKAGRAKLWADVEVFAFEGDVYKSALLPGSPERIIKQLEAVSPFVDKIFIYQYTGMINKPGTDVFAGHPDSTELYKQLKKYNFLKH